MMRSRQCLCNPKTETYSSRERPRNAVLRQNVVPTSGWRSCTAVPVELTAADVDVFKGEAWCK